MILADIFKGINRLVHLTAGCFLIGNSISNVIWTERDMADYIEAYIFFGLALLVTGVINILMVTNLVSYHLASVSILILNWIYDDNQLLLSFIDIPYFDRNTSTGYITRWLLHLLISSFAFFNFISYDSESLFFGYQASVFIDLICAKLMELEQLMSRLDTDFQLEMIKCARLVAPQTYLKMVKQSGYKKFEKLLKSVIQSHQIYCEFISGINVFMSGPNFVSIAVNYIVISVCILEILIGKTYFISVTIILIFILQITIPCVIGFFISYHVSISNLLS